MKLDIKMLGVTLEDADGGVHVIFPDGEPPPNCIVLVMTKESYVELKVLLKEVDG